MTQQPTGSETLKSKDCPYCGRKMDEGFFLIGGDVRFAKSRLTFGPVYASDEDIKKVHDTAEQEPAHVLVGSKGYHSEHGTWPKHGLFCKHCLTFVIKGIHVNG